MMTGTHPLLVIGGILLAILLAFCMIGWGVRLLDKPGWYVAAAVALWLVWEMVPGSHPVMMHLWTDLQSQAGQVGQQIRGML